MSVTHTPFAKSGSSRRMLGSSPTHKDSKNSSSFLMMAQQRQTSFSVVIMYNNETMDYDLDVNVKMSDHMLSLCDKFKIESDHNYFALCRIATNTYVTDEDLLKSDYIISDEEKLRLEDQGKRAEETIRQLENVFDEKQNSEDEDEKDQKEHFSKKLTVAALKRTIFDLNKNLRVDIFAEEFIGLGGLELLLKVVKEYSGNTQGYALKALSGALCYLNGLEYVSQTPGMVEDLCGLMYNENPVVVRYSLSLVFVVCKFLQHGYDLVNTALEMAGIRQEEDQFEQLVNILQNGDVDLKINSLTLVNTLLSKAPSDHKKKKTLKELGDCGIYHALENQNIASQEYMRQVEIFRKAAGTYVPPAQLEVEVLRAKVTAAEDTVTQLKDQINDYRRHKQLVNMLSDELFRYRNAVHRAHRNGTFVNAYAPLRRHDATYRPTSEEEKLKNILQFDNLLTGKFSKFYSKSGATISELEEKN